MRNSTQSDEQDFRLYNSKYCQMLAASGSPDAWFKINAHYDSRVDTVVRTLRKFITIHDRCSQSKTDVPKEVRLAAAKEKIKNEQFIQRRYGVAG